MKSDEPEEIDGILERALSSYSQQEPRPGLEDRVLRYLFAAGARPSFGFPPWAFAAAAAALLLILVPIFWLRNHSVPAVSQAIARDELKAPARGLSRDLAPPALAGRERKQSRDPQGALLEYGNKLPKQPKFPAPSPVTDEERAWLVLAGSSPDEVLKISEDQTPDIAPIRLEAMHIQPLQIDGLQQGAGE